VERGYPTLIDTLSNLYHDPTILSVALAPDGSEAVFTGVVRAEKERPDYSDADFVLRVVKEHPTGKWVIRFARITERKSQSKGTPGRIPEPRAAPEAERSTGFNVPQAGASDR
jgi:hypothetical protein